MARTEAILFDVDGTLVDSNDLHADCWVEAFAHFGKEVPWDVARKQIGKGGDLLVPDTLNAREMRAFGEALKEYRSELWKEKYIGSVRPFPAVRDAIEELRARGIRIAVASSSKPDEVDFYLDLLDIRKIVDASTSKGDAEFSKPVPEIFEAAVKQVGSDPMAIVVVGDTPYDILAAHRAALPIVAVLSGGFTREILSNAEFLFADVSEVARRFDEVDAWFEVSAER